MQEICRYKDVVLIIIQNNPQALMFFIIYVYTYRHIYVIKKIFVCTQCTEILLNEIWGDVNVWCYYVLGLWVATICDVCSSPACSLAALTRNSIREIQLA
jgi:hypothetical protein